MLRLSSRLDVKTVVLAFFGLLTVLLLSFFPRLSVAQSQSIGSDITSLSIVTTAEPSKTINQAVGDSEFAGNLYTLNFLGLTQSIKELSYARGRASVDAAIPAKVEVQRKPRRDQRQLAWYFGTFNPSKQAFTFFSSGPLSEEQLLSGNNILAGYDNVFTNTGANTNLI